MTPEENERITRAENRVTELEARLGKIETAFVDLVPELLGLCNYCNTLADCHLVLSRFIANSGLITDETVKQKFLTSLARPVPLLDQYEAALGKIQRRIKENAPAAAPPPPAT